MKGFIELSSEETNRVTKAYENEFEACLKVHSGLSDHKWELRAVTHPSNTHWRIFFRCNVCECEMCGDISRFERNRKYYYHCCIMVDDKEVSLSEKPVTIITCKQVFMRRALE